LECYANNLANEGTIEGRDGPLRKGKRAGGRHLAGKEKPRRSEPTGRGDWLGLVTRKGRQNEKQSEKETQG
jgi:hypothetical protein